MTCGECGNVTAPGTGFPNHVYCKRFLLHMEKQEDASRCRDFIPKPKTNADRIRSMTDEELAEWLCDIAGWLPMYEGKMHPILDWLKEEAKE